MSGAITQWQRKAVDLKMAAVMIAGGLAGTVAGVFLFGLLRKVGQTDLVVSVSYVIMLGSIGTIMLRESIAACVRPDQAYRCALRVPGSTTGSSGCRSKSAFANRDFTSA